MLLLLTSPAEAQQPKKIPQIGYLIAATPSAVAHQIQGFREGLRDLGYIEGKNIQVEYRYAEGKLDRLPGFAAELVQDQVEVFVSGNPEAVRAARNATKAIPIVMILIDDPVATGFVDSLAHPGANITGLTRFTRDLNGKRLELLKEAVPKLSRVGVLWCAEIPSSALAFKEYKAAAPTLNLQLQSLEVREPNPDFEGAFQAAAKGHVNALVTVRSSTFNRYRKQIAELAIKNRLPSMTEGSDYVEPGGLMSYSSNDADQFRRAAYYVDRILKGARPADMPVEQPEKFELVINLKTAKQIGLSIPPDVLALADKVIR
jgi:putative ABC transport system substrate-binding protein